MEAPQPTQQVNFAFTADASKLKEELKDMEGLGRQFAASLTNAFEGVAIKGKGLGDVLKSLALSLSNLVLKAAMKPLETGLTNLFAGLFSGVKPFAQGGVVNKGMPVPFAQGGVIQAPITFPLAGGRMGLAGEAGPEAIMPLARGPDGRLGVAARGGAGTNVTVNITTQDAESFRKSETQVAAVLARAVSLGQRNL